MFCDLMSSLRRFITYFIPLLVVAGFGALLTVVDSFISMFNDQSNDLETWILFIAIYNGINFDLSSLFRTHIICA